MLVCFNCWGSQVWPLKEQGLILIKKIMQKYLKVAKKGLIFFMQNITYLFVMRVYVHLN